MPTFRIEQYELHAAAYTVEAKDKAEAILKVLNGQAEMDDGGLEYVEVAEDYYRPTLDLTDEEIRKLDRKGHSLNEDGGIPSIRSAEHVRSATGSVSRRT